MRNCSKGSQHEVHCSRPKCLTCPLLRAFYVLHTLCAFNHLESLRPLKNTQPLTPFRSWNTETMMRSCLQCLNTVELESKWLFFLHWDTPVFLSGACPASQSSQSSSPPSSSEIHINGMWLQAQDATTVPRRDRCSQDVTRLKSLEAVKGTRLHP